MRQPSASVATRRRGTSGPSSGPTSPRSASVTAATRAAGVEDGTRSPVERARVRRGRARSGQRSRGGGGEGRGGPGFARTGRRLCPSAGTPAMRRRSTSYEGGRGRAFSDMMGLAGGFIRAACVPVLSGCGGLGGPGELECDVAGAPAESARRTMGTFKRRGRNGFVAALRAVGPGLLQLVSDSVCDLSWHLALSPTRCSWGSVCAPPA